MEGQLWPEERQLLHQTVLGLRPELCLEIGTWKGGGSTWQIIQALVSIGAGKLVTCEPDDTFFGIAADLYTNQHPGCPIEMYHDYSQNVIRNLVEQGRIPDFVFMDGPEDPDVCYNDLLALEAHMKPGSIVGFHDWDTNVRPDGLQSTKSVKIRPYMESSTSWTLINSLTAPVSVGIAFYRRV